MDFKGFIQKAKEEIRKTLGKDVFIREFKKNNGIVLTGMYVKWDNGVGPVIYLEPLYREYEEQGEAPEIFQKTAEKLLLLEKKEKEEGELGKLTEWFLDFEKVRDRITYRLVNQKENEEQLAQIPHVPYLDLAVVFDVYIERKPGEIYTILLRNTHLEEWGKSLEEIYKLAEQNTPVLRPAMLEGLMQYLNGNTEEEEIQDELLYILTNRSGIYGASVLLYDGILKEAAEKLESDLIIIPSSVHEVLLLKEIPEMDFAEMSQMVMEVNCAEVNREEQLSDHVYRYLRKENRVVSV